MAERTYPGFPDLERFVIEIITGGPANGLPMRDLDAAIWREYGRSMWDYELEAMGDRLVREGKVCRTVGGGNFYPVTHTAYWCGHGSERATDVPGRPATDRPKHIKENAT